MGLALAMIAVMGGAAVVLARDVDERPPVTTEEARPTPEPPDAESVGIVQILTERSDSFSECTGMVFDELGTVLTVANCVEDAAYIDVHPMENDEREIYEIVGYDRPGHVAMIRPMLDIDALTPARFGNSDAVVVGMRVTGRGSGPGIGKPLGRNEGQVEALDASTSVRGLTGRVPRMGLFKLSFDAAIGDSGGPLFDADGRIVGMLVEPRDGGRAHAIPIDRALAIARDITSEHPSDAVHVGPAAKLGLVTNQVETANGLTVHEVVPLGPASFTDVAVGDVIVSIAGVPVASSLELIAQLDRHRPGDVVVMVWRDRAGMSRTAEVTLDDGEGISPPPVPPMGS